MEVMLTPEQVLGFAPDANVTRTCRTLAAAEKWTQLGTDNQTIWGEFTVVGKKPFQIQAFLDPLHIQCTCHARSFPCNHGLALFLLYVEQPALFVAAPQPAWITLEAPRKNSPTISSKPVAYDKKRQANIVTGLLDLEQWMHDLVRNGLATVRHKPPEFWEQMAHHLVDAQASELADEVRILAKIPESGTGWAERLLQRLGRLQLLIEAFKKFDELPLATQADLHVAVGWLPKSAEINSAETVTDQWFVLGKQIEMKRRRRVQRTWLWGMQSNRAAQIVNIAHGRRLIDADLIVGTIFEGDVAFHVSQSPQLAQVLSTRHTIQPTQFVAGYATIEGALLAFSQARAKNPWLGRFPFVLSNVQVVNSAESWMLHDAAGHGVPLVADCSYNWHLMALASQQALNVFGEWQHNVFTPLSLWTQSGLLELKIVRGIK